MRHLGDITKISGRTAPVVDVIIGGSPCQDLSIAGQRAGLAGERSGLFMEQLRIVREMREEDMKRGRTGHLIRPRYMVWENVPGTFSSNGGKDFSAVLTEIVRVVEPSAPDVLVPRNGWPTAGCLYDALGRWSLAWRVHDAQFWGVPQRRRRISVVADFGGRSAPEILFERKGLRGNIAEVRPAGEAVGPSAGGGADLAVALRMRAGCDGGGKGALVQIEKSGTLGCGNDQVLFCMATGQAKAEITKNISPTLNCNHEQPIICLMDQGGSVMETLLDKTGTLRAQEHGHQPVVLTFPDGVAHALLAKAQLSNEADHDTLILQLYENHGQDSRITGPLEIAPTVAQKFDTGGNNTPLVLAVDCRNGTADPDVNGTLQAKSSGGQSLNLNNVVLTATETVRSSGNGQPCVVVKVLVRRLTPLECDRLNGYPDGWTDIGPWVDSKGKLHKESSDSARYKAQGNSIALPFWKWLCKRISAQYERDATMASLFDGIGGFPLVWEQINGKGSCLWASEIEEFPIAVTKYHFEEGGQAWEG